MNSVKDMGGINVNKTATLKSGIRWNTFSAVVLIVIRLFRGFVIPKVLAPASYGLFTSISLFLRYFNFFDLGATYYFSKEFPHIHFNRKSVERDRFVNEVFSFFLFSFLFVAGLLIALSFFYDGQSADFYQLAFLLLIPIVLFSKIREFYNAYAYGVQNYKLPAISGILYDLISLVFVVLGIYFFGTIGGVCSMVVVELTIFFYYKSIIDVKVKIVASKEIFSHIKQYLKQFFVVISEIFAVTLDQLFIFNVFFATRLGFYSLGITFGTLFIATGEILKNTILSKIMILGKSSEKEAMLLFNKTIFYYLLICALAVPMGIIAIEIVVTYYFDNYILGLEVYFFLLVSGVVKGVVSLMRIGFIASNKEKRYILCTFINITYYCIGFAFAYYFGLLFNQVVVLIIAMDVVSFFILYSTLNKEKTVLYWKNLILFGSIIFVVAPYQFLLRSKVFDFKPNFGLLYTAIFFLVCGIIALKSRFNFKNYLNK